MYNPLMLVRYVMPCSSFDIVASHLLGRFVLRSWIVYFFARFLPFIDLLAYELHPLCVPGSFGREPFSTELLDITWMKSVASCRGALRLWTKVQSGSVFLFCG
ncbi:hypothetical protein R1flu_008424 [Riccia fluitans]|uniref:Uncharacterized protein n=1 Tax=Riccia fluitans TaxID=41844 RepID=A0ABD1YBM9_9MARC